MIFAILNLAKFVICVDDKDLYNVVTGVHRIQTKTIDFVFQSQEEKKHRKTIV